MWKGYIQGDSEKVLDKQRKEGRGSLERDLAIKMFEFLGLELMFLI